MTIDTHSPPIDPDLSTLSLPDLLMVASAHLAALQSLPTIRQQEADPDLDALNRELELIQPLRRALTERLLQSLGSLGDNAQERQAVQLLMSLCQDEGVRKGRVYAAQRQAWLARMARLTSLPAKERPADTQDIPAPQTRSGWKMQRDQLERRIEKLQTQLADLQGTPVPSRKGGAIRREKPTPRLSREENAARRAELLAALRSWDAALDAQDRLEERLSRVVELYGDDVLARRLGNASQRERENLLTHFRRRLNERFGLSLSYAEVSALDRRVRLMPVTHRTGRGTAVKRVQVAEHTIYAVVTPDRAGDLTLTTAYTAEMLDQIGGF